LSHDNFDIRLYVCDDPLGAVAVPLIRTSGPGSRWTQKCSSVFEDWTVCDNKISSAGSTIVNGKRHHIFYSLAHVACCSNCWMDVYDSQKHEEGLDDY